MATPSQDTIKSATGMAMGRIGKSVLGGAKAVATGVKKLFVKKPEKLVPKFSGEPVETLGEIYKFMRIMDEDRKLNQELVNAHVEEQQHLKDRRNQEIITALSGRKKKPPTRKQRRAKEAEQKKQEMKPVSTKLPEVKPTPTPTTPTPKTGSKIGSVAVAAGVGTAVKIATPLIVGTGLGIGAAIAKGESAKGSYNAANKGTKNKKIIGIDGKLDLENMTVGEVMRRQAIKWGAPNESEKLFAVGKYQMIPETFAEAVKALNIKDDVKFDGALQERMFQDYLLKAKRPAIAKYLNSPVEDPKLLYDALKQLSLEWASIADPDIPGGKTSHYGSGNVASLSVEEATTILKNDRLKIHQPEPVSSSKDVDKMSTELSINRKELNAQQQKIENQQNLSVVNQNTNKPEEGTTSKPNETNALIAKGQKK